MKLSAWAKKQGISYRTAWAYFKAGQIPNARQMETGTILVDDVDAIDGNEAEVRRYMLAVVEKCLVKLFGVRVGREKLDEVKKVIEGV